MKVLVLPNFKVERLESDRTGVRDANKHVSGMGYWFFRNWRSCEVDVLDISSNRAIEAVETRLRLFGVQGLRASVRDGDYDLVVSHSYNSGFVYSLLRSICSKLTPPHLVIDVGCLNGGRSATWQLGVLRFSLRSVAGLVYHAKAQEEFYKKHFPDLNRRFIPFGINVDDFRPLKRAPTLSYAISIGYAKRDLDTLFKAWRTVALPLLVVGPALGRLPLAKNITVIPFIGIDRLREYIHDARIVVLPIEKEPYSVGQTTLLQCMAMGKPVIVSNVAGVRDYVRNGTDCLSVPYGDPSSLTSAVESLSEDEGLRDRIGKEAISSVRTKYSEALMAERMSGFAEQLISASR